MLKSKVKRTVLQEHCTFYKVKAKTIMLDRFKHHFIRL